MLSFRCERRPDALARRKYFLPRGIDVHRPPGPYQDRERPRSVGKEGETLIWPYFRQAYRLRIDHGRCRLGATAGSDTGAFSGLRVGAVLSG